MDLLGFGAQVVFTSASGVISPGPLFFANLVYGSKQGIYSGIKMAYGHTIVELPLIIILALSVSKLSSLYFTDSENLKIISLIGGVSITVFSLIQIRSIIKRKVAVYVDATSNKKCFSNKWTNYIRNILYRFKSILFSLVVLSRIKINL